MKEAMLTTIDNPHSPFDDYPAWFQFDTAHGYNSAALLARIAVVSDEISETDQLLAIEQAIDEIVHENVSGMHRKITREI